MNTPFQNRREAGEKLAKELQNFADSPDAIVLALPRGGVPVAFEVAKQLHLPLDVLTVRKLGVPGYEELALGAIASGSIIVLNKKIVEELKIPESHIEAIAAREQKELERRERLYRGDTPLPNLNGRIVILVDDGIATGSTMKAAVSAVKQQGVKFVVVATPVAPPSSVREIRREADEVIALATPSEFMAVGQWYLDFSQTTDDEVRNLLKSAKTFNEPQPA